MPTSSVRLVAALAITLCVSAGARAQAGFDGTYRGQPVSGTGGCSTFSPTLRVKDGTVTLRYNTQVSFEGQVAPDGSLQVFAGQASLSGKFADGRFTGQVGAGRNCRYTLDLAR